MNKILLYAVSLLLFFSSFSCAPAINNLSFLKLKDKPTLQIYKDPSLDSRKLNTFAVIPISKHREKPFLDNDILEMQMLFFLRSTLEELGYRFVNIDESPDFLATLDGLAPYEESYIPPQQFTMPKWVPGKEITTYGFSSGSVNIYGGGNSFIPKSGNYSGSSVYTTHLPGYMTTETYTVPGHTVGSYYPTIGIYLLEPKTFKRLYVGVGAGTSDNADLRISSQLLIYSLFRDLPKGPLDYRDEAFIKSYGFGFLIMTANGNDYYPIVIRNSKDPNQYETGLMQNDIILSINGTSTKNKSTLEMTRLFHQASISSVTSLQVYRLNKVININVTPLAEHKKALWAFELIEKSNEIWRTKLRDENTADFIVLEELIANYTEAINHCPNDSYIYLHRGRAYAIQRNFSVALNDFNQAILLNPNEGAFYYFRGHVHKILGRIEQACSDAHKACQLGDCELLISLQKNARCQQYEIE
jgi:hypothetical protein